MNDTKRYNPKIGNESNSSFNGQLIISFMNCDQFLSSILKYIFLIRFCLLIKQQLVGIVPGVCSPTLLFILRFTYLWN